MDQRLGEAIVKRWLYTPRAARQVDIRAALEWQSSTLTEMAMSEFVAKISSDYEATTFLRAYVDARGDFDVRQTAYFETLLHRYLKPYRRIEKLRRDFPDSAPEEAVLEIGKVSTTKALDFWEMLQAYNRLQVKLPHASSAAHVEQRVTRELDELIDRFERLRKAGDPARTDGFPEFLNVVRPPAEALELCFSIGQRKEIRTEKRWPLRFIDEPGLVACLRLVGARSVPVAIHDLRPRQLEELPAKWYQPRDVLLSGTVSQQYSTVEKLLARLAPGRRVIDVGTNAGLVALLAARHGARSVVGLERREGFHEQSVEMLAHWKEKGLLSAQADVRFIRADIGSVLPRLDEADLFLFLKVLYHISSSGSEVTTPSRRDMEKDKVVRVFERLRHRRDALIIIRANLERERRARREKGEYGNRLALPEFILPFLERFDFEGVVLGGEFVVARHREGSYDLDSLADVIPPQPARR